MSRTLDQQLAAIRRAPDGPHIGAFFDYDGTLIDGFSAGAYYKRKLKNRQMGLGELFDLVRMMRKGDPTDDEFMKLIGDGVAGWAGLKETEFRAMWRDLFVQAVSRWMFPEGYWLIAEHLRKGHTVAIASSATRYQIEPLAEEYGIEHILSTELGVARGVITGKIKGRPPWGQGKADRVAAFAEEKAVDLGRSFGYANGNEDMAFLQSVGKPVAVNPKEELARMADMQGWPRMDFEMRKRAPWSAVAGTVRAYSAMAGTFALGYAYGRITGDQRGAANMITSVGSELGLLVAGIKLEVHGEENLWKQRPAVFMVNHQSKLEFFLFLKMLRRDASGVAKKEAENVPGFGAFMKMLDFAFLDRSDSKKAIEALQPAVDRLKSGLSIGMSPEGTRSYSPRVGKFKKGGFHVAMQAGVPIVPVIFRNVAELMPRDAQFMRAGTAEVSILPPIPTDDWTVDNLNKKIEQVRQLYIDTMDNWPRGGLVNNSPLYDMTGDDGATASAGNTARGRKKPTAAKKQASATTARKGSGARAKTPSKGKAEAKTKTGGTAEKSKPATARRGARKPNTTASARKQPARRAGKSAPKKSD